MLSLHVGGELPLKAGHTFHNMTGGDANGRPYFGAIKDTEGKKVAFLREYIEGPSRDYKGGDFVDGLRELHLLKKAGVCVARHVPFIADNRKYLLVQHFESNRAGELNEPNTADHPEVCAGLAQKVARYSAKAILGGRNVLTQISAPFQYTMVDGQPVLADLDAYQLEGSHDRSVQHVLAAHVYKELTDEEHGLIPLSHQEQAPALLMPLYDICGKL